MIIKRRALRLFGLLASVGILITSASGRLCAQGHFQGPKTSISYPTYQAVWECLAAVQRVRDSIRNADPIWRDTLPWGETSEELSIPAQATEVAQQCGKTLPDSNERSILPWIELMLLRNDTKNAERLVEKEVTHKQYASSKVAVEAMREVLLTYGKVRERPLLSMEVLDSFLTVQSLSPEYSAVLWGYYLNSAKSRHDLKLSEIVGGKIIALVGKLGNGEGDGGDLRTAVRLGIAARYQRELLDTLRAGGTAAYKAFLLKVYEEAVRGGWMFGGLGGNGEQAPTITAPYWYPTNPEQTIPTSGRVSLLVFLDNRSHRMYTGYGKESFDFYATLQRIKNRYPDLDVTLVARTSGWFGHGPVLSVAEEGPVLRKWLLDVRHLPGRLAIDSVPWYRMPGMDRRRVNQQSTIGRDYQLGVQDEMGDDALSDGEHAVLISPDGMIMKTGRLRRGNESEYAELIDILMSKQSSER